MCILYRAPSSESIVPDQVMQLLGKQKLWVESDRLDDSRQTTNSTQAFLRYRQGDQGERNGVTPLSHQSRSAPGEPRGAPALSLSHPPSQGYSRRCHRARLDHHIHAARVRGSHPAPR